MWNRKNNRIKALERIVKSLALTEFERNINPKYKQCTKVVFRRNIIHSPLRYAVRFEDTFCTVVVSTPKCNLSNGKVYCFFEYNLLENSTGIIYKVNENKISKVSNKKGRPRKR